MWNFATAEDGEVSAAVIGIPMVLQLCAGSSVLILKVCSFDLLLSSINTPYLDAVIIDGPKDVEDSLVFLGQVTCRGSEKYLNECIPDIMPLAGGGCNRAAISCGKSSSKENMVEDMGLSTTLLTLSKPRAFIYAQSLHKSIRIYIWP